MANRAIPYIHQTAVVLSKKVKEPNDTDWQKLVRLVKYLKCTNKKYLILIADDLKVVKWYVGASFAAHPYFKSHIGDIITMVQVAM